MNFKTDFIDSLPGERIWNNTPRQTINVCYAYAAPKGMFDPKMIIYSMDVAKSLGLSPEYCQSNEFLGLMSGNRLGDGSIPYAMCYGGHQFGQWAGQLGDGRAINLGEIMTDHRILNVQLKGAGPTAYSRTADGLAVLRSSIREFLCSEAVYHLGIPTTRALSLCTTGEEVWRDIMYNGNPAYEKGAIVSRVAPSFIRFGNFEILAARNEIDLLKLLTDYTIERYYPHIPPDNNRYLTFFTEVMERTCEMIIHWMRVGFVHGVMNTDNMSILGLTIDYGPYGWLDNYDGKWTPNTTDLAHKRYRFENQAIIAQWNLYKLANALFPLINDVDALQTVIDEFQKKYQDQYLKMMRNKLGLFKEDKNDHFLIDGLLGLFGQIEIDMTLFFRLLAKVTSSDYDGSCHEKLLPAFYSEPDKKKDIPALFFWYNQYIHRLSIEDTPEKERIKKMNRTNPKYVLRNYMAQLAIEAGNKSDFSLIHEFYEMLQKPYEEAEKYQKWFSKRPDWAKDKIGCSMLSCSS